MRRRWIVVGAVVAAVAMAGGAAAVAVRRSAEPPTVPPGAPAAAVLRAPVAPATVGSALELTAYVISGSSLAAVQLWAGGAMVDEVSVPGARRVAEHLEFTAREPGSHLLVLRVVDDAGRVTHAAPVRVRAEPAGAVGPVGPAMRRVAHAQALAGPDVTVATAGCEATVRATPDPRFGKVALFGLGPGDGGFQVLGYGGGGITVPLTAGENAVYALAFDDTGSSPSDITMVRAPEECATRRWQGTVSLVEGILRAPGQPPLAYLYLSVDDGQWQRVPAADQTFVHRNHLGELDFGPHLPSLEGAKKIEIEAWTRKSGKAVLLGQGSLTAQGEEHMPALVGFIPGTPLDLVMPALTSDKQVIAPEKLVRQGEIHLYKVPAKPGETALTVGAPGLSTFRWKPPLKTITHGVWQVSMVPPLTTPSLEQPGLLAFDTVDASSTDFEIDFRPLVLPDYVPPTPPKKSWFVEFPVVAPKKSGGVAEAGVPVANGVGGSAGNTVTQIGSPTLSAAQIVHALTPPKLYVRIVPMADTQPVDAVSNAVVFTMYYTDPTPPTIKPAPAIKVDVKFSRPSLWDGAMAKCVRVLKNDNPGYTNGPNPPPGFGKVLPNTTYCPAYEDDEGLLGLIKSAVDLAVDFWDTMVDAFGYLKAQAVTFIVTASGCEAFEEIKDECGKVAGLAVDAALVYFGIPPTLPNSSELFAIAKGDLVDALYAMAEAGGVSCDEFYAEQQCKEMMAKALDAVIEYSEDEVSEAAKSQATSAGGKLPYLHPSIVVIPEPRGHLRPAIFVITYTRTSAKAKGLPTACVTLASVRGDRTGYTWLNYDVKGPDGKPTHMGPATVGGPIYEGANPKPIDLAALVPGQSVTRVVVLDTPKVWFPPGGDPIVGGTVINSDVNDYAELMVKPSVLTARIDGCGFGLEVDAWDAPLDGVLP